MANISLDKFISNLKELQKNPIKVMDKQIVDFAYAVLWQIAKHTIIDSGQARASIIRSFADKYNKSTKELKEEFPRYWQDNGYPENEDRDWDNYNEVSTISDKENKLSRNITVSVNDEGFFYQAKGGRASPHVTYQDGRPRDNSNFKRCHVDYFIDRINNKEYGQFEKLDYDKLVKEIVNNVENYLFKK